MSWAEAKWTVNKVNTSVDAVQTKLDESGDAGKDMYIRGIRRPKVVKQISVASNYGNPGSSSGTITGSGWLVSYHLYMVGNRSGNVTITLDDDSSKQYTLNSTGITQDQNVSFSLTSGGSLTDPLPIRFKSSLTWSMYTSGDSGFTSVGNANFQYILDDSEGGGRSLTICQLKPFLLRREEVAA